MDILSRVPDDHDDKAHLHASQVCRAFRSYYRDQDYDLEIRIRAFARSSVKIFKCHGHYSLSFE